jgi:hypothetical protein
MAGYQVVCARGSMRTALWCWLTKMAAQALTCIPFILFLLYVCAEAIPKFLLLMSVSSILLATLATAVMLSGKVTAGPDGVRYSLFGHQLFIPWNEMEFRPSNLFTLEKPYAIARRGERRTIKIWPSMDGYEQLKAYFAGHRISLEQRTIISIKDQPFRSFDEVLGESLSQSSRR